MNLIAMWLYKKGIEALTSDTESGQKSSRSSHESRDDFLRESFSGSGSSDRDYERYRQKKEKNPYS